MPRDMKPIAPGRLDALKGMIAPSEDAPMPETAEGYEGGDLEGIIETLAADILPNVPEGKRRHIEAAISELEKCLGVGEAEEEPAPMAEPEPPAA